MAKSAEAFRTISEVAEELDVPNHVLRFWELRFPQVRPMKRGGGRRYYRPADVELLKGIRHLLHAQGYTIKGVQKILREQGIDQVKNAWRTTEPPRKEAAAPAKAPAAKRAAGTKTARTAAQTPAEQRRRVLTTIVAELEACRALLASGARPGVEPPAKARRARSA